MDVSDYNGEGRWSRENILSRYAEIASKLHITPRDLSPMEHSENGRRWVFPVMYKVIEGIEAGDAACACIGIEFIEEDAKVPFGKILKSKTARALRRTTALSEAQKKRIRGRVFGMLAAGHVPHEFGEYAKLVRTIGFDRGDIPAIDSDDPFVKRFRSYFESILKRMGAQRVLLRRKRRLLVVDGPAGQAGGHVIVDAW